MAAHDEEVKHSRNVFDQSEVGTKLYCREDFVMKDGRITFKKGKYYSVTEKASESGLDTLWLLNEEGNPNHGMDVQYGDLWCFERKEG